MTITKLIILLIVLQLIGTVFKKIAKNKQRDQQANLPEAASAAVEPAKQENEKQGGFDLDDPGRELADFFKRLEGKAPPVEEEPEPAQPFSAPQPEPERPMYHTSTVRVKDWEKKEPDLQRIERPAFFEGKGTLLNETPHSNEVAVTAEGEQSTVWKSPVATDFFDSKDPLVIESTHTSGIIGGTVPVEKKPTLQERFAGMSFGKQGIVMAEIFGKPKALQD